LAPLGVRRLAVAMLLTFGFLMLLTLFFATEVKGARRWLSLAGVVVQPSEFVKPALAVASAWLLTRKPGLAGIPETAAIVLLVLAVLAKQPDIGMAAVIGFVYATQLFIAGINWIWIAALLGCAALAAWQAYLLWPHFQQRVDSFLDPQSLGYQV